MKVALGGVWKGKKGRDMRLGLGCLSIWIIFVLLVHVFVRRCVPYSTNNNRMCPTAARPNFLISVSLDTCKIKLEGCNFSLRSNLNRNTYLSRDNRLKDRLSACSSSTIMAGDKEFFSKTIMSFENQNPPGCIAHLKPTTYTVLMK